jgi:GT2 family glycosyltransferase
MTTLDKSHVTVVTVTYGHRQNYLELVIQSILNQGISSIVLVANGVSWDIESWVRLFGTSIHLVMLSQNKGSAGGFAVGIQAATQLPPPLIWLLDDDNQPCEGSLDKLLKAYAQLTNRHSQKELAVFGFRKKWYNDRTDFQKIILQERPSSFLRFHILDIPNKIRNRTPWKKKIQTALPNYLDQPIKMKHVPYGGLLFHRDLLASIGLPREDFVLYVDDAEFTYRITRQGGGIYWITDAEIEDLDFAYKDVRYKSPFFKHLHPLNPQDILRRYYLLRNFAYFNTYDLKNNVWIYFLNQKIYLLILWILALKYHRMDQYRLVRKAIQDGLDKNMGISPDYPLS